MHRSRESRISLVKYKFIFDKTFSSASPSSLLKLPISLELNCNQAYPGTFKSRHNLRWPNTVFARALANAIQRAHKDCKKKKKHGVNTAIILFVQYPRYLNYFSSLLNTVH